MSKETGQQGFRRTGTFQEDDLKVCDLCSSLNLATNGQCYTCGWHGRFERSHEVVHTAIEMAIQTHGRLELQDLTDIHAYAPGAPSFQARLWVFLNHAWRWLSG